MSAGDPKIIGSLGSSPAYTEAPNSPVVSYEIDQAASKNGVVYVKKTLTRTLVCLKKDVAVILQGLAVVNASLSASAGVDYSGAVQTVDFGGGWTLKNATTPAKGGTSCEINLVYEQSVPSIFEFDLPANVTVVYSGGKVQFKYKGTILEMWDSGLTAKTTGLQVGVSQYGTLAFTLSDVQFVSSPASARVVTK